MKLLFSMITSVWIVASSPLAAQTVAPRDVVTSAIDAVEALGKKVVMGEHKAAIDSMYPLWKKRMAKRKGGIEELEKELGGIGEVMARNGVSIISFRTDGAPRIYEVWPGADEDDGEAAPSPVYTKWLLLIPTVTQFRIMKGQDPKGHIINSYGFQVAISDKDKANWSFINGSDVSISDLRSIFPSLPANMEMPAVRREQAE